MSDWLLLRLPHADTELATWLVVDARGAPVSPPQSGPLPLAAARAPGRRVCVLVGAAEVMLADPEVPVKAGAKLQQLVPYALEEHLADDIEDLHFAIGKRSGESTRVPVAVVARALLDGWLAELRGAGIEPDAIYADSELLPQNPGQAVALLEADTVSVRPPRGTPVTLPADALGEALEIARAGAEPSGTSTRRRSRRRGRISMASRYSSSRVGRLRSLRTSSLLPRRSTCCRDRTRRCPRAEPVSRRGVWRPFCLPASSDCTWSARQRSCNC